MARQLVWHDNLVDQTVSNGGQVAVDMIPGLSEDDRVGCTITRLIGVVFFHTQLTLTSETVQVIDLGIGVMSADAFAAGAMPDPDQEGDQPSRGWLYRSREVVWYEAGQNRMLPGVFRFDVRAQRKLDRGTLVMVVDSNNTEGSVATVLMRGLTRTLCRLP